MVVDQVSLITIYRKPFDAERDLRCLMLLVHRPRELEDSCVKWLIARTARVGWAGRAENHSIWKVAPASWPLWLMEKCSFQIQKPTHDCLSPLKCIPSFIIRKNNYFPFSIGLCLFFIKWLFFHFTGSEISSCIEFAGLLFLYRINQLSWRNASLNWNFIMWLERNCAPEHWVFKLLLIYKRKMVRRLEGGPEAPSPDPGANFFPPFRGFELTSKSQTSLSCEDNPF